MPSRFLIKKPVQKYFIKILKKMKILCILIVVFLYSDMVRSQPGWQDYTVRYFYSVLDESGKEISFKNNKDFSILIDNKLYQSPNIPQKKLKSAKENSFNFENQICINDFSLAIPIKSFYETQKQLEIKIIHEKDTMHICQNSGTGSIERIDFRGITEKLEPDFTLRFIAGHYYFPSWSKNLFDKFPQAYGEIKILNFEQHHFIIPKTAYDSVCYINRNDYENEKIYDAAENHVVKNFMRGKFSLERIVQPTTFSRTVKPLNKPRWSYWGCPYLPTKEQDKYLGIVEFSYDTLNYSGGRGILVKYNYKENKMQFWSATERILFSSTYRLRKDTFNNVFYQQTMIRDSSCEELIYKCDFVTKFYRSSDEGSNWEISKELTELNKKHEIRELQFLDYHHALFFKREKIKSEKLKYEIQQGTYYLLRDFRIIDSLKTPNDLHYNDNYNRYGYESRNDTIFLGKWSYTDFRENKPFFQPLLIKIDESLKFEVIEKTHYRYDENIGKKVSINTQNFKIVNKNELVFKNKGSIVFEDDLSELYKKGFILENGSQIFIVGLNMGTLLSFDGGINWYIYPLPLEKDSRYDFLEIDEQSVISHLKNNRIESGYEFNKVFSRFIKSEE